MRAAAITALAVVASTAVFAALLAAGASPHVASLGRLVVAVPILYLALAPNRDRLRVGFAVASATGAKLMIEPLLATVLGDDALIAPLIGDLGYGALITYVMLRSGFAPARESAPCP